MRKNSTLPRPILYKYVRLRKAGMGARYALVTARVWDRFEDLEDAGLVRIVAQPDEDATIEDAAGERDPHMSDRSWQEYLGMICDRGIYGVVGEYRVSGDSEWVTADSVWGCAGYRDVTDPAENWYVGDIMSETLRQYDAAPLRRDDLPEGCRIVRYTGERYVTRPYPEGSYWEPQDPHDLSSLPYGDLHEVNAAEKVLPTDMVEIPYSSGSDYSGSLVEKSNHRVLLERYGDLPGVWGVHGGLGTYAIVVSITQKDHQLWEDVRSLTSYPLLDEDDESRLECEEMDSNWESWVRQDFESEIRQEYHVDLAECADSDVRALFESTEPEWYDEGMGSGMYVDVSRAVKAIDRDQALALSGATDEDSD